MALFFQILTAWLTEFILFKANLRSEKNMTKMFLKIGSVYSSAYIPYVFNE